MRGKGWLTSLLESKTTGELHCSFCIVFGSNALGTRVYGMRDESEYRE